MKAVSAYSGQRPDLCRPMCVPTAPQPANTRLNTDQRLLAKRIPRSSQALIHQKRLPDVALTLFRWCRCRIQSDIFLYERTDCQRTRHLAEHELHGCTSWPCKSEIRRFVRSCRPVVEAMCAQETSAVGYRRVGSPGSNDTFRRSRNLRPEAPRQPKKPSSCTFSMYMATFCSHNRRRLQENMSVRRSTLRSFIINFQKSLR